MIKLDVKPYCNDCPDFTPDVEAPVHYYADFDVVAASDTIVRCKYRKRCESMVRFLQNQIEEKGD